MATVNSSTGIDYESYNVTKNKATSNAEDIQNRFLKLLTTQLKTQDPSNPMDNAQMTSQMAQISTVSGLESVNQSIKALSDNQSASQSLLATLMIGRHALIPGNEISLSSGAAKAVVDFPQSASNAVVTIKNAAGVVVSEIKLGAQTAGQLTVGWDGKNAAGVQQPDGQYSISVQAVNGSVAVDAKILNPVKISSVAIDKGVSSLVLENGKRMSMSDVTQLI
ncbi:flagellar hook assembly protein FlgD [Vogesella fluminis]|uniref:Basal-body rod modification protein FlgD n=1 Tax=Vogesella fluminis TaxID=1069161 RepID=A0ABQ3HC80_9NEIS|nr:flagellar hook assembly protein FlgD [Vogesella fluminis]GHD76206.1 basal-body rod modification protein FlgD [Vogesella fluminis]